MCVRVRVCECVCVCVCVHGGVVVGRFRKRLLRKRDFLCKSFRSNFEEEKEISADQI
jgi:hypothetical protein